MAGAIGTGLLLGGLLLGFTLPPTLSEDSLVTQPSLPTPSSLLPSLPASADPLPTTSTAPAGPVPEATPDSPASSQPPGPRPDNGGGGSGKPSWPGVASSEPGNRHGSSSVHRGPHGGSTWGDDAPPDPSAGASSSNSTWPAPTAHTANQGEETPALAWVAVLVVLVSVARWRRTR